MRKFIVIFLSFLFLNVGVSSAVFAEEVMYNTETQKVHKVTCAHAKKMHKKIVLKLTGKTLIARAESLVKSAAADK